MPPQEQTDVESFELLEPDADGFRNYLDARAPSPAEALLVDKRAAADPDRAGDDGAGGRPARAGRQRRPSRRTASSPSGPETLTNDFFVNLLDMGTAVEAGVRRRRGRVRGQRPQDRRGQLDRARRVDLVFGSQLRSCVRLAEVYAGARREGAVRARTSWRRGPR